MHEIYPTLNFVVMIIAVLGGTLTFVIATLLTIRRLDKGDKEFRKNRKLKKA